jgi:hypothetical protein
MRKTPLFSLRHVVLDVGLKNVIARFAKLFQVKVRVNDYSVSRCRLIQFLTLAPKRI